MQDEHWPAAPAIVKGTIVSVTDAGEVTLRLEDGKLRLVRVPLEQVPRLRKERASAMPWAAEEAPGSHG